MGVLVRELKASKYIFNKAEMLPELLLLGELESKIVPLDTGELFAIDVIHYEGKMYVMKQEACGRWFEER